MELIAGLDGNLAVYKVHHTEVQEQDLNARVMPPEMFERLAANIKHEKRLESLPFGVLRGDKIELVSGHHRARAAVSAGLLHYYILVDIRELTKSKVRAKQLAHNAIAGVDNAQILARLFSEIATVEDRLEAFTMIDDSVLKTLDGAAKALNEELEIEWPVLSMAFLPLQMEKLDKVVLRLAQQVPKNVDVVWALPDNIAARFTATLNRASKKYDIRTTGNILAKMLDIVEAELDNLDAAPPEPEIVADLKAKKGSRKSPRVV